MSLILRNPTLNLSFLFSFKGVSGPVGAIEVRGRESNPNTDPNTDPYPNTNPNWRSELKNGRDEAEKKMAKIQLEAIQKFDEQKSILEKRAEDAELRLQEEIKRVENEMAEKQVLLTHGTPNTWRRSRYL